jgi:hypothetical protein
MSESCRFGMQINNNHLEKYGLLLMKYILPPNEIHTPDIFKKKLMKYTVQYYGDAGRKLVATAREAQLVTTGNRKIFIGQKPMNICLYPMNIRDERNR